MTNKVIDYIDDNYIITESGEYYKRCVGIEGCNTILCFDSNKYHYESFMYNGHYRQFTVSEISKDNMIKEMI